MQLVNEQKVDIAFIQEPFLINNKLAIIPTTLRTYTAGNRGKRAAIVINNKDIDATTINQISDEDCVVAQITYRNQTFFGASMYFDGQTDIEDDIKKSKTSHNISMAMD